MGVADIVQEHQQSVEEQFGSENFIVVMRGMVDEADTQALKVIEKFSKDHGKVTTGMRGGEPCVAVGGGGLMPVERSRGDSHRCLAAQP